jgi:hypothetical protein
LDDTAGKGPACVVEAMEPLVFKLSITVPTAALVDELLKRQGVEAVATLEPRETMNTLELAELEGPGILLWITD